MTIDELKDYFKTICLAHRDIKGFQIGNDYNQAQTISTDYPIVFYELPYSIQYRGTNTNLNLDTVGVAFNVFVESNRDNVEGDHTAISKAKEIGDAIITYIENEQDPQNFLIGSASALSVREFTDDSVAGMRFELTILLPRTFCDVTNFKQLFNLSC